MANAATIYAQALFETGVREGSGAKERYGELLRAFARAVTEIAVFSLFLKAPERSRSEKKRFLSEIFSEPADATFLSFLCLLIDRNRMNSIAEIARLYDFSLLTAQNAVDATIETAFPLDEQTVSRIVGAFREKIGASEIRPTVRVVPDLVGGVRVLIGSHIYDGTLRSGLERLRVTIKTRGINHGDKA